MGKRYFLAALLIAMAAGLLALPGNSLALNIYPNPFSTTTTIEAYVPTPSVVTLVLYTKEGEIVRDFYHGPIAAGLYTFTWDGTDSNGNRTPGQYSCELSGNTRFTFVKKTLILK